MRVLKWLDENLEEFILMILLIAMSCAIMLQIVMRYFFSASLTWTEEFARYCFVWTGMLSLGYCLKRGSMLRIDIVYLSVPKIFQKILDAIGMVIGILFYGYAFKASLTAVEEAFRGGSSSPAMQIPMYIIYMSAAIGFGLAILRQIQIIVMTLWGASHRQEEQTNCKGGDEEC